MAVDLQFDDEFRVESHPYGYVLKQKKVSEDGNEYETRVGDYGTLDSVFNAYKEHRIRDERIEITSWEELNNLLNDIAKTIQEIREEISID